MKKYLKVLFHIEANHGLSNFIIAIGLLSTVAPFVEANVNNTLASIISLSAWIFIIKSFSYIRFSRGKEFGPIKKLVIVMLLWNVFMIVYGMFVYPPTEPSFYYRLRNFLMDPKLFLPLLLPLTIFFDNHFFSLRFFFYWISILSIIYLVLSPWALWSMTHWSWSMDNVASAWGDTGTYGDFIMNSTHQIAVFLPPVIGFFCKRYLTIKWWRIFLITAFIGLFIQMYLARRGGVVLTLAYFLVAYWVYFRRSKRAGSKITQMFMLIVICGLGYVLFMGLSDSAFSLLLERGAEDTRSGVANNMITDFNRTPVDWWIGRGLWGTYYDPDFDNPFMSSTHGQRWEVETGYLCMIIHGGYIYLFLYVSILLYSGLKGLFSGRNILLNSLGAIQIMSLISLFPYGIQMFDFSFLTLWIGVYLCCQAKYQIMTDEQVFYQLFAPTYHSRYNILLKKVFQLKNKSN